MKGKEKSPAQPANADLPPQVQADQCLLEAEQALQNSDDQTAKTAFQKIESLNIEEPPPDFFFLYGKFLMENCNVVNLAKAVENGQVQNFFDNLLKARSILKQFLTQVQRTAANYKPALELLSTYQSIIKAVTSAAKEFEELAIIKNKRAGETFLIHLAADYTKIVISLIKAATDVNAKNDNGETPLHNAAEKGQVQVVEAFLAAGVDVDIHTEDEYGCYTPLHCASYAGHVEVVKTLPAAGIDVDVNAEYGEVWTSLYKASEKGHVKVVKALHAGGANVNAEYLGGDRWTPLHEATVKSHVEVVKALLAAGADVNAKDKYGETPLSKEVAEILRDAVKKTKLK